MIRVTLDANVLASGSLAVAGSIAALIEAWRRGEFAVTLSAPIVAELERALSKPYFAHRLDPRARTAYLRLVHVRSAIIPITTPIPNLVSEYPDNLVLATAESGGVAYLVTGDAELLRLGAVHDITILSPRAFLEVLDREGEAAPQRD